jgi:hypothetical protein
MSDAIEKLRRELANDPLGRGYATQRDAQIANDMNVVDRPRTETSAARLVTMAGDGTLQRMAWMRESGASPLAIEGAISTMDMQELVLNAQSRAEEIGIPPCKEGHVQAARL